MILFNLNEKISSLEIQIETLNIQMRKIYDNRDTKTVSMPKEYYKLLKERQALETKLRTLWNEQSRARREMLEYMNQELDNHFVNSYGEATKREITTTTYQRAQKRMIRAVLCNMGVYK